MSFYQLLDLWHGYLSSSLGERTSPRKSYAWLQGHLESKVNTKSHCRNSILSFPLENCFYCSTANINSQLAIKTN